MGCRRHPAAAGGALLQPLSSPRSWSPIPHFPDNGTDTLPERIDKQAAEPGVRVLALSDTEDDRLDGLICCHQQTAAVCFILGLRVREESRGRGHAARLLRAAEKHARAVGVAALLSCTISDNPAMAERVFPRAGWRHARRLHLFPSWPTALRVHEQLQHVNGSGDRSSSSGSVATSLLTLLPAAAAAVGTPAADALMPGWRRCESAEQLRALLLELRAPQRQAGCAGPAADPDALHDWLPGEYHTHAAHSATIDRAISDGDVWLLQRGTGGSNSGSGAALWVQRQGAYRGTAFAGVVAGSSAALAAAARQAAALEPRVCKLYIDCLHCRADDIAAEPLFSSVGAEEVHDCLVFAKPLL